MEEKVCIVCEAKPAFLGYYWNAKRYFCTECLSQEIDLRMAQQDEIKKENWVQGDKPKGNTPCHDCGASAFYATLDDNELRRFCETCIKRFYE